MGPGVGHGQEKRGPKPPRVVRCLSVHLVDQLLDQSGKLSVTTFLRAMDKKFSTTEAIIREFYPTKKVAVDALKPEMWAVGEIIDTETGEQLVKAGCQIGEALAPFVEDFLDETITIAKAGIFTILFDQPWNHASKLPGNCKRAYNWDGVLQLINNL